MHYVTLVFGTIWITLFATPELTYVHDIHRNYLYSEKNMIARFADDFYLISW